ncbi:peptidase inhibitor family I36 protein [Solwaraspora sp. WMMD791]|uniref:peptidase inhibitor family I36 protein n=1 Tax=Solwaraspora sp. WMMD791 TaxID=3016086 RepID=UPI00249BA245|nr:peptidase inhibitor family I36 protein [Solwaraspora sp. WMMD791]WFE26014.1 peptidase inhibitor family I36 protein [Solwaraspora sp. WMMD791]
MALPIRNHRPGRWLLPAALILTLLATGAPAVARPVADPDPANPTIEQQIAEYLAAHPGGVRINETELAYSDGRFIVSVARPAGTAPLAGPDCPSGWFCFYDGTNYGYPRGRLSDCGWQDLGNWGWRNRTESAHYHLGYGSTTFLDETGATDSKLFVISAANRAVADVSPHRNRADYVYRICS